MKHLFDHLTGQLLGYVNVHSGEWALYTPWDSKEAYGPGLPVRGSMGLACQHLLADRQAALPRLLFSCGLDPQLLAVDCRLLAGVHMLTRTHCLLTNFLMSRAAISNCAC